MPMKPARAPGVCSKCNTRFGQGHLTQSVKRGDEWIVAHCATCRPDLAERERQAAEKDAERAEQAQSEAERVISQGGAVWQSILAEHAGLLLAIRQVERDPGFAATCAASGITPHQVYGGAVAEAGTLSRALRPTDWIGFLTFCASHGVSGGQTPKQVYLYNRGGAQWALTPMGLRQMIARKLDLTAFSTGWAFPAECTLGTLALRERQAAAHAAEAQRLRAAGAPGADILAADHDATAARYRAEPERERARLAAAMGQPEARRILPILERAMGEGLTRSDISALPPLIEALCPNADDPRRAVMRGAIKAALAAMRRSEPVPLSEEDLALLQDWHYELSAASTAGAQDRHLAAGLALFDWAEYDWYAHRGATQPIGITAPSVGRLPRPAIDPADPDAVPALWYASITWRTPTGDKTATIEVPRDEVYRHAVCGKTVRLDEATGLLVLTGTDGPWMTWQGEMGSKVALAALLKATPDLALVFAGASLLTEEQPPTIIEGTYETASDHLRAVRRALPAPDPLADRDPLADIHARAPDRAPVEESDNPY